MLVGLYSIYDVKTQVFSPPFLFHNDAQAMRELSRELNKPDSNVSRFPEDFELRDCGTWDDNLGTVKQTELPRVVCRFSEMAKMLEPKGSSKKK